MKTLSKKQTIKAYKKIVKKLHKLQVAGCRHISRQDNNQLFEIAFFIKDVIKRIDQKYPDLDYPRVYEQSRQALEQKLARKPQ